MLKLWSNRLLTTLLVGISVTMSGSGMIRADVMDNTTAAPAMTQSTPTDTNGALAALAAQQGTTLYNGQCYGLSAWYAQQLGGPQMMGSGHEFAKDIGSDYDWASYGFTVINNPTVDQIHPGDIICWDAGGAISPGIYGHTGVVESIDADGNMTTLEQNAEQGQVVAQYHRAFNVTPIKSVIHKN